MHAGVAVAGGRLTHQGNGLRNEGDEHENVEACTDQRPREEDDCEAEEGHHQTHNQPDIGMIDENEHRREDQLAEHVEYLKPPVLDFVCSEKEAAILDG